MTGLAIAQITLETVHLWDAMLDVFAEAFDEPESYSRARPPLAYRQGLLASGDFIAFVAFDQGRAIGALAGYELRKFEQARSEIYIYDLAVAEPFRRRGVASRLIEAAQRLAAARGAGVLFVQADRDDAPAVALYEKFGPRQDVLHFDIAAKSTQSND